jgi:hypothetical protein
MGGHRPFKLAGEADWLRARPVEKPDLTLRALVDELAEREIKVTIYAVWHFLEHIGLSFKKTLHAAEQQRPDVARRCAPWQRRQAKLDPNRLVFIDETWAKTNMTRRHGRSSRCQRLVAAVPHGHWNTLTFLAALRADRITAPCVLDGPINGASFLAYVEQSLVPTLRRLAAAWSRGSAFSASPPQRIPP